MDYADARNRMVKTQIVGRGVLDPRVIEAMRSVPREVFVRAQDRDDAYADGPLPIGEEQTISQPYVVAAMIAMLEPRAEDRALEVGAGSGYAAAVLGRCVREVWAIERHASLAEDAAARIARLGIENVHVIHGDGTHGLPERAPFDVILVSAGGPEIPAQLIDQLAEGGRMVIPIGSLEEQSLVRIAKRRGQLREERHEPVRFVPLISGV